MAILLVFALLGGIVGFMFLSNATTGVGIIAFSCLIAILARVAQAAEQHREIKAILEQRTP
jgi:hypothetical protein